MDILISDYLNQIETQINKTLSTSLSQEIKDISFGKDNCHSDKNLSALTEPTSQLVNLGGKRWRPLLAVLTAQALLEKDQTLTADQQDACATLALSLTPVVEFVHTASLIHDDIEDSSEFRRGKPAAYKTFGIDVAVNAGAWLFFHAGTVIDNCSCDDSLKLKLYQYYTKETRCVHLGQAMDISWHKDTDFIPSRTEYFSMVENKTGTLAALSCELGVLSVVPDDDLAQMLAKNARKIGIGFQIIDDVINITTGNVGKKRGDDIVEGKKSLPIILFTEKTTNENINQMKKYFIQASNQGIESPAVENAIELLNTTDCIQEAKQMGIDFINSSLSELEDYFGSQNKAFQSIKTLFLNMIPKNL